MLGSVRFVCVGDVLYLNLISLFVVCICRRMCYFKYTANLDLVTYLWTSWKSSSTPGVGLGVSSHLFLYGFRCFIISCNVFFKVLVDIYGFSVGKDVAHAPM